MTDTDDTILTLQRIASQLLTACDHAVAAIAHLATTLDQPLLADLNERHGLLPPGATGYVDEPTNPHHGQRCIILAVDSSPRDQYPYSVMLLDDDPTPGDPITGWVHDVTLTRP